MILRISQGKKKRPKDSVLKDLQRFQKINDESSVGNSIVKCMTTKNKYKTLKAFKNQNPLHMRGEYHIKIELLNSNLET